MNDTAQSALQIEVAFALPERQVLLSMQVPAGCTVAGALELSDLRTQFPDVNFTGLATGIWGQLAGPEQRLRNGDRLEIYRPLQMDPREARRRLAEHGRVMGQKSSG
ncbi:MAG: RnfH family protein [Halioglobus sp.]|nr:RnfH family protein [Halioglobus sp.]